jgi:hypothetical protein
MLTVFFVILGANGQSSGRSQHTFSNNGYPAWYNLSVNCTIFQLIFGCETPVCGTWRVDGDGAVGAWIWSPKNGVVHKHSLRHFKTVQTCFIGPSQIYRHAGLLNFTEGPWHQMLNRHSSQILWPKNPLLATSLRELTVNSWKTQSILHLNISAVQISTLWDPAGRNMCLAQQQSFSMLIPIQRAPWS